MKRLLCVIAAATLLFGAPSVGTAQPTGSDAAGDPGDADGDSGDQAGEGPSTGASEPGTGSAKAGAGGESESAAEPVEIALPAGSDSDFIPLGDLEKQALIRALVSRGLRIDFEPKGKTLRTIHVYNLDPISDEAGFLTIANRLHVTTREYIIEREILLRPGEEWSWSVVRDSQRRLRSPTFTSLAVLVPVKTDVEGKVDLLVVTRDIFSLRLNSDFSFVGSTITSLRISPSENNFLGLRKRTSIDFNLGLGRYSIGPSYSDPNIAGTRLTMGAAFALLFSRETDEVEGSSGSASINYPLYDLRSRWAAGLGVSYFDGVARQFDQTAGLFALIETENPDTGESLPHIWDQRNFSVGPAVTRSFPTDDVIQRVTLSYQLRSVRPEIRDDFIGNQDDAAFFRSNVLPRSERASIVRLRYLMFTPTFVVYRNVDTYDLPEESRVGPRVSGAVGFGLQALGSETDFIELGASASWVHDLGGDAFFSWSLSGATRWQLDDLLANDIIRTGLIDTSVGGSVRIATPMLGGFGRFVGRTGISLRINESQNRRFFLGGDGLRGFELNAIEARPPTDGRGAGPMQYSGNLEFRTRPWKVSFTRVGAVAFWDWGDNAGGDVADGDVGRAFRALGFRTDVGVGFRMLLPELQPAVFRIDLAIPLTCGATVDGVDPCPSSGFRLTGGFSQAF